MAHVRLISKNGTGSAEHPELLNSCSVFFTLTRMWHLPLRARGQRDTEHCARGVFWPVAVSFQLFREAFSLNHIAFGSAQIIDSSL